MDSKVEECNIFPFHTFNLQSQSVTGSKGHFVPIKHGTELKI